MRVVCWYLFHVLCFSHFLLLFMFAFSLIFSLQNCIQVYSSLKSILKITIFCFVESLYFYVFLSQTVFHTFFSPKSVEGFLLYYIFFTYNIDFLTIFYFIVLYLSYTFNTDTWWERKMLSGLICSRSSRWNRNVNKQWRLLQISEFVWL
jgi:hypothetical protein